MQIIVCIDQRRQATLIEKLRLHLPEGWQVVDYQDAMQSTEEWRVAVLWQHPKLFFNQFPHLRGAISFGAGADQLLTDPIRPNGMKMGRTVTAGLRQDMANYVLYGILDHTRNFADYRELQKDRRWQAETQHRSLRVGILGLGALGSFVAQFISRAGFAVAGYSRHQKSIDGVRCYAGQQQMAEFLGGSDVLVNLLALNKQTEYILSRDLFSQLPSGAKLINVARGGHLFEADLLSSLANGQLSCAQLDVFNKEPLPSNHPFWSHPNIKITPHIAALTDLDEAAEQIIASVQQLEQGGELLFAVK